MEMFQGHFSCQVVDSDRMRLLVTVSWEVTMAWARVTMKDVKTGPILVLFCKLRQDFLMIGSEWEREESQG